MSKTQQHYIEVFAHWVDLAEPTFMGVLHSVTVRGKEIFSFEYSHDWLKNNQAKDIDPSRNEVQGGEARL